MQEKWVQSLGPEALLEKEMASQYSILTWETPWTEEPGGLQSINLQTGAWLSNWTYTHTNDNESQLYLFSHNLILSSQFSSVQSFSHVWLFVTPWPAAGQASLSNTNSWSLPKFKSVELVMPSNHLILCHSLLFPPSIFLSIGVFSNESVLCIRWPKYWSFSFSISLSNEHPRLISFGMDWWDLLAVQGTLKSLQHHSSKASILWHSEFFLFHYPYIYREREKEVDCWDRA